MFFDLNNSSPRDPDFCLNYSLSNHTKLVWGLSAINGLTVVFGTFGNVFVCIAVLTTSRMTSSFHYFIASLAAADLTVSFVDQPLLIALIMGRTHNRCLDKLDEIFRAVGNFACAVSLATLTLIALDRCLFVARWFSYKNSMTTGKKIVLVTLWLLAVAYTIARLKVDKKITSYLTVVLFAVCYTTIVFCYSLTYYAVRKQYEALTATATQVATGNKHGAGEELESLTTRVKDIRTEKGFARTILMLVVVFTCAWALLFYLRLSQPDKNYGIMYNVARTIALSSSAFNPVLYCFNNKEYRRAFKRILRKLFSLNPHRRQENRYEKIH